MANLSITDKFLLKFPALLIETFLIGLILCFLVMWADIMDKAIFLVVSGLFLLIGVVFEFQFGSGSGSGTVIRGSGIDAVGVISQAFFERKSSPAHQADFAQSNAQTRGFAIDKRLSRDITKALCLSAVSLWAFAEVKLADNPSVHQVSQMALIAILVLAIPFICMGFVQLMRHPRLSASRAFSHYINISILLLGVPSIIFFLFLASVIILLLLFPQQSQFTQAVSATILVSIIAMVAFQAYYIYSTVHQSAKYHGLSVSEYIRMKLSKKEKERQKEERKMRGERIDELYERIPAIRDERRPMKPRRAPAGPSMTMPDYEYASDERFLPIILKGLLPGFIAAFLCCIIYLAFFLWLAQMGGF